MDRDELKAELVKRGLTETQAETRIREWEAKQVAPKAEAPKAAPKAAARPSAPASAPKAAAPVAPKVSPQVVPKAAAPVAEPVYYGPDDAIEAGAVPMGEDITPFGRSPGGPLRSYLPQAPPPSEPSAMENIRTKAAKVAGTLRDFDAAVTPPLRSAGETARMVGSPALYAADRLNLYDRYAAVAEPAAQEALRRYHETMDQGVVGRVSRRSGDVATFVERNEARKLAERPVNPAHREQELTLLEPVQYGPQATPPPTAAPPDASYAAKRATLRKVLTGGDVDQMTDEDVDRAFGYPDVIRDIAKMNAAR